MSPLTAPDGQYVAKACEYLRGKSGPAYWRSLEELAERPELQKFLEDEFPDRTLLSVNPQSRRRFLQVLGASLALAGAACTRQPRETIVPYVKQPEQFVPGEPLYYATSIPQHGLATGLLVKSNLGRPTKVEGNPLHPASLGATDTIAQASVLTLYDPDRSNSVLKSGSISTWDDFLSDFGRDREDLAKDRGRGLRILTGTVTSPTLGSLLNTVLSMYPDAKWHQYEPCSRNAERLGAMAAFDRPFDTVYQFAQADVIVSLDSDFLCSNGGGLRYTRDFTNRRKRAANQASDVAPRLYVAENSPSITGGMADHRMPMRSSEIEGYAAALARRLGVSVAAQNGNDYRIASVAKELDTHRGSSIVIAGEFQPPRVHALAHAMNQTLRNIGKTVTYIDSVEVSPVNQVQSLRDLVNEMNSGAVTTLLIVGGNPVYDAPAELGFLNALKRVPKRIHLGLYADETSEWCHWHIPEAHYLESWGDARAWDGTLSLIQPLIEPLYGGHTAHEVLNVLLDRSGRSAHDDVHDYWQQQRPGDGFEDFWQTTLHDGVMANTAFPLRTPPTAKIPETGSSARNGIEIVFRPDPTVEDGALANNAWLQELPKPQSKVTWDNAAWVSPRMASEQGLSTGSRITLSIGNRKVEAPVWVMAGQADDSVTIHFGYGRRRAGHVGSQIGFDAYALWPSAAPGHVVGASLTKASGSYSFAEVQTTQTMEERDPLRVSTLTAFRSDPQRIQTHEIPTPAESLFPMWQYTGYKWGMSIDLTACVGCQACMVACQSENNIPVVGKTEVAKGRHMNWLRVDRYFSGSPDNPSMYFQPVPCMHCETAPCEPVCPVAATVHNGEGLNQMVYNRCVGTRYCSNNCPYKVRRFNFLLYSDWYTQSLYGLRNPDVTVRSRGVMEKCSYCVQRIERAKIEAEKQDRRVRDAEIQTACAQACPAQAIVFGDLNDPNSAVSRLKKQQRDYGLLADLQTRPRTTYLARLNNPNPEWSKNA